MEVQAATSTVVAAREPILALDLGTTTGWAFNPGPGIILSATWDLHPKKGETEGERYRKFAAALTEFHGNTYLNSAAWLNIPGLEVFYEDVRRHLGTRAAHVYGGLLATLKTWCLEMNVREPTGVGVGEIKKFWTGRGNATKEQMIEEAHARGFDPVDDNEADALALLHMRIVEGPEIGAARKSKGRKAKTAPARQTRRPVARRPAKRLRKSDRRVSKAGRG